MLRSRLDEIAAHLDEEVDPVVRQVAVAIAAGAARRAPRGATGDLAEGYEAEKVSGGWAVMALWRWFFTEFGTVYTPPQPHLVPAVEAERNNIDNHVKAALRDM